MQDLSHVIDDAALDVPLREVPSTSEIPRAHNDPAMMRAALELPVVRACWLLRHLGIETTASSANHKHLVDLAESPAGIGIANKTLSLHNRAQLAAYAARHPQFATRHENGNFQLSVPLASPEMTARQISDRFIQTIEEAGLKPQPALWAEPISFAAFEAKAKRPPHIRFSEKHIEDEQNAFFAMMKGRHYNAADGMVYLGEETPAYYADCLKRAAPEASLFDPRIRFGGADIGR